MPDKKNDKAFKLFVLSSIADIIRDKKHKKELVDVINKHIEFDLKDSIKRVPYNVSQSDLAEYVNDFLTIGTSSFNNNISALVNRYVSKNYSNADGNGTFGIGNISNAVGEISKQATINNTESEDGIKVALINKGIINKKIIPLENKVAIVLLILATGLFIYAYFFIKNESE